MCELQFRSISKRLQFRNLARIHNCKESSQSNFYAERQRSNFFYATFAKKINFELLAENFARDANLYDEEKKTQQHTPFYAPANFDSKSIALFYLNIKNLTQKANNTFTPILRRGKQRKPEKKTSNLITISPNFASIYAKICRFFNLRPNSYRTPHN